MVSGKTDKRKTVEKKHQPIPMWLIFSLAAIISFLVISIVSFVLRRPQIDFEVVGGCPTLEGVIDGECESEVKWIPKINLQPTVDTWVSSIGGEKGVIIYDLDTDEIAGEYNANERMRIESIYKLFVVYEGYLRIQRGEWDRNASCGYTGWTILECLDKAVRESNSNAAETLWAMIGRDNLDTIVQSKWDIPEVVVGSISATPTEIMKIMRKFYYHKEITDSELVSVMMDSFLNQPPTTYDWRRGLPRGFSDNVKVYNKVGWLSTGSYWLYYDDAAIVEFSNGRKLIIVVLTKYVDNTDIARFGREIEAVINTY